MMRSFNWLFVLITVTGPARAQVPIPFTSPEGRAMVFANKRFEKLEARPMEAVYPMEGRLVYLDHDRRLKVFIPEGRKLFLLEPSGVGEVRSTRQRIAWLKQDTLKTLVAGRTVVLAHGVSTFTVTDSSVVHHDSLQHELVVSWRGRSEVLATITDVATRPQWQHGGGEVVWFERASRRLMLFHHGSTQVLCDSTDMGHVAMGTGTLGYWDDAQERFLVWDGGRTQAVSELRPVSAKAGAGLLAFVDGAGGLRCYADGKVRRLTDEMPSGYWVQDSLLLYLEDGALQLFDGDSVITVEPYVPERWQVEGGLLVHLDINRELWSIRNGERKRLGNEANIRTFDLYGDAVIHPSPTGLTTILRGRRNWTY